MWAAVRATPFNHGLRQFGGGKQTPAAGGMDRAGTCTSFTVVKASLEVAPTTAAGVTHLQFPFQVCFSSTLPDLVFPVSLSLSADR